MKKVSVVLFSVSAMNAWEITQPSDPSLNPNWGYLGIGLSVALLVVAIAFWQVDEK